MSDEDFSEEDEDFSVSEDEWKPGNNYDEGDSDDDFEEDHQVNDTDSLDISIVKTRKKKENSNLNITKENRKLKRKSIGNNSLRAKMFKKYQPPPKVFRSPTLDSNSPTTSKLSNTSCSNLKKDHNKISNKTTKSKQYDSDSSSSGDEALVNPNELDLKSSFFDIDSKQKKSSTSVAPNFDCDGGMNLINSEEEEEDDFVDADAENDVKITTTESPFKKFYDFNEKVEQVKDTLKKYEIEQPNNSVDDNDIAKLLSMGEESKSSESKTKKKLKIIKTDKNENSDSDWEKVEEYNQLDTTSKKEDGSIQITVNHSKQDRRPKKTISDEEASLMRKLNRVIKENQINKHKISLLCQIAHGIFVNRVLNNENLMTEALKLLPNGNKCYPDGKTEIGYFEAISKWYSAKIKIKCYDMYSSVEDTSPLLESLVSQIQNKEALCKKSFALIFIILLRAMGIKCRMVLNLVTLPIRPAQADLCTVKTKNQSSTASKAAKKPRAVKKSNESLKQIESTKKVVEKPEPHMIQPSPIFDKVLEKVSKERIAILSSRRSIQDDLPSTSSSKIKEEATQKIDEKSPEINSTETVEVIKSNKRRSEKPTDEDWQPSASKKNKDTANIKVENKRKTRATISTVDLKTKESTAKPTANFQATKIESEKKPQIRKLRERSTNTVKDETVVPPKRRTLSTRKKTINIQENSSPSQSTKSAKLAVNTNTSKGRAPSPKLCTSQFFNPTSSNNKQSNNLKNTKKAENTITRSKSARINNQLNLPQMDGADDIDNSKSRKKKKLRKSDESQKSQSDDDFVDPPKINIRNNILDKVKIIDRRVLSTDDEATTSQSVVKKKNAVNIWIEVYSEKEDQWITIDIFHTKVHCVDSIRKQATPPISYVLAWNNDNSIKDVSPRYCPDWNTVTRKNRIEKEWLNEAIKKYLGKKSACDISEDQELDKIHLDKPLPKTIHEFKNHPLYALERHLLKFEALYPPNAPTLGFIRGEPVYSRDCVHLCHSREIWLKEARVVKLGEKAYKVVKARPKWDKLTNNVISNLPLDIFGYWQTSQYEPPIAENGIVPRNAYGNVELFKDCMLPKKTVHLRLPGLPRVCKKLVIDCAPAVIGFDFHQGSCHPMLDGFVICEEFEEVVVAAWHQEQEEIERREQEKYELRVYGNWKKLIKGLFIRQKLKRKYNFEGDGKPSEASASNEKNKKDK